MEEDKTFTQREQMLILTSAIILAGKAANYSTVFPSIPLAIGLARELLDSICGPICSDHYQREGQAQ